MSLLLRRGIFSGALSGFTPAEITTLAWWDAADTGTISGSPLVTQIDDKGSTGIEDLVQGTAASQMSTGTRTHNGKNVLDGDGLDYMERASFPIPSSGNIVFYGVFGVDSIAHVNESLYSCNASNQDFELSAGNSSNFRAELESSGIGGTITPFATNKNGPSIYKSVFDFTGATEFSTFVDDVENPNGPLTYTTKLSSSQTFRIMSNREVGRHPNGFFAEVVIVETVDERIDEYLKAKWNTP